MSHVLDAPEMIEVVESPAPLDRPSRLARAGAIASHPAITLTVLTAFGAALRFWKLSQPALWGDEAATFRRVCGTFQQLIDQLATGGFTPLHYLLYFWIAKHAALTPFVMRLPTAIFGTLLIPAIYFLARQLVRPPVALLAATLTACSAYQLNFSRDAKMYSDLWLCGTLHMACFLWWLRTRSGVAWWGWVAAGTAMLGLQLISAALFPIELLMLLTAPRGNWRSVWPLARFVGMLPLALVAVPMTMLQRVAHLDKPARRRLASWRRLGGQSCSDAWRWRRRHFVFFAWPTIALFLLGLGIAAAAPCVYYVKFNSFFDRVYDTDRETLNWMRTGIGWVSGYNAGRDGTDLIRYTATAFGFGWEWPRVTQWKAVEERTGRLLVGASVGLLALALLGALPLTRRRAWVRRRSVSWIALWIILPAYAFYCASMPAAVSPIDWIATLLLRNPPAIAWPALPIGSSWPATFEDWVHHGTLRNYFGLLGAAVRALAGGFHRDNLNAYAMIAIVVAAVAWLATTMRLNRRSLFVASQAALTLLGLLLLCVLVRAAIAAPFPHSVWIPRYLGFVWPAFAIATAALFWRLPTRPIRWTGIALLLIVNLSQFAARVLAGSEPPTELMAKDIVDSQPPLPSRLFSSIPASSGVEPGTGVLESMPAHYYLAILSGKPIGPDAIRGGGFENQFLIGRPRLLSPLATQVRNLIKDPSIHQLIVWDELRIGQVDQTDALAAVLPDEWKKVSETSYVGREHWTWTDYYVDRRRVYQKAGGG